MGKGDKKSKRGKIFAGSYGKVRPKPNKLKKHTAPAEEIEAKETKAKEAKEKKTAKKVTKKTAAKKEEAGSDGS
jgi:30S ribosomal protein S31